MAMAMAASKLLFFFCPIFINLLVLSIAQADPELKHICSETGNFTNSSDYKSNLNILLSSFSSNTKIDYGFYNDSYGQNNDKVTAISLCRGDKKPETCRSCITNSRQVLTQLCPNQKEAYIWYDDCMLRYSNRFIVGSMEFGPHFWMYNLNNVTDEKEFYEKLNVLLGNLTNLAALGDSRRKFATGNATTENSQQKMYALVQCTPDLTQKQCSDCLNQAIKLIPTCCYKRQGGRVISPSCHFRYEKDPFYELVATTPSPSPAPLSVLPPPPQATADAVPPRARKKGMKRNAIIIISIVPIAVSVILIVCVCIFLRARRKQKGEEEAKAGDEIESAESLQFAFSTIRDATEDFSEKNKLGQGGFGAVYKGALPSGQEIAVKRLSKDSGQGDLEFKNEVLLVARLQHRNLVRLLGFCLQGIERLLIYEFMPNASLDHFIFDPIKRVHLNWERRYKIIGGIARGLLYLHEDSRLRIIHRDLKASNILLDEEMNPKISDFGMARLFVVDQTQGNTSRIVGTYGYMAPEYAMQGHFSVKSDVFSFGVLVLEIVTGKKNSFRNGNDIEHLLSHAWRNWREGTAQDMIDPVLSSGSATEMMRCIHIGLLCVQENVADRPTMASVVLMLSSSSLTLQIPSQPAFFMNSSTYQSDLSSSMGHSSRVTESSLSESVAIPLSKNEVSITELYPR
ncbi:cysteine-rich receptor-like protein kinase 26 isoform X4 [Populus nigra]|uniref:cysteine-rich receptor-like protein kinase 26 isoform X4 n=1 Tax=Populus nigra TaxID=3691 RepID=UPI002B26BF18|nr:cysteine-rich receptor-like protein kinase 26 isoform X4 [Populus nigra]